jgi:ribonuclease D
MRAFSGRASRTEIDRWWAAVEAGLTAEELPATRVHTDALPPPRAWADRNPEADRRLKAARPELTRLAAQLNLPPENLLTPETLRRVAWDPPQPPTPEAVGAALAAFGARPWQVEAVAEPLAEVFVRAAQAADAADAEAS